MFIKVKFLVTN